MMAAQRSTVAGDKCTHSKEGLHADTESGCQVQYSTVQYSRHRVRLPGTLHYSTVQYSTVPYSTVQCSAARYQYQYQCQCQCQYQYQYQYQY